MTKGISYVSLIIISLIFSGCGGSKGADNNVKISDKYLGTWLYTYPSTQCVESFTFNSDGSFFESNLDERQSGTFTVTAASDSERERIDISVQSDNSQANCLGNTKDGSGLYSYNVEFPIESNMEWYTLSIGGVLIGTHQKK